MASPLSDPHLLTLIDAAIRGEEAAVDALFADAVYPFLDAILLRKERDPETRADLIQEGALKLFQALPTLRARSVGEFRAYVNRAALNLIVDRIRAKRPELSLDTGADDHPDLLAWLGAFDDDSLDDLVWSDVFSKAVDAMQEERPDCVDLLQRLVLEVTNGKELAALLGRTEGAARTHVWDCRKVFRRWLGHFSGDII